MGGRALIGHTGFVGGNLLRQRPFDAVFNSTTIEDIRGRRFDLLVFAGAQAKKWWANREPAADLAGIERALAALSEVSADRAVLISTVDVLPARPGLDEAFAPDAALLEAYGRHRLRLEAAFRERFPDTCVLRLPALFGPGLRKNVLFDLLTGNQLERINPDSRFQYYDLTGLAADLERALECGLGLVHLVSEPLPTATLLGRLFPAAAVGSDPAPAAAYDLRTRHAALFGGSDGYIADAETVLRRIAAFVDGWRQGGG